MRTRVCSISIFILLGLGCSGDKGTDNSTGPAKSRMVADGGSPTWSADGNWLAVDGDGYVVILSTSDNTYRRILTTTPSDPSNDWDDERPDWSPDDQEIAFEGKGRLHSVYSDSKDIWIYPAAGGDPFQVTTNRDIDERSPAWSPDGSQIAYFSEWVEPGIYIVAATGGTPVRLTERRPNGKVSWSPDGKRLAFGFADSLFSVSVSDSSIATIASLSDISRSVGDCTWSSDGATIAFAVYGSDQPFGKGIWVVNEAGGSASLLFDSVGEAGGYVEEPDWSPDGKSIAVKKHVNSDIQEVWIVTLK